MENNTIQIDRYLQNEMSGDERAAFERQLAGDKILQEELRVQKLLITAANDTGLKTEFAKAFRKRMVMQRTIQWGIIGAVVVGVLIFLAIRMGLFSGKPHPGSFKRGIAPAEQFEFDNTKDTIIETKDGVVFAIPAGAFRGGDKIQLEIQTALTPYAIMEKGLSTTSNGALLQTGGMFYINGYKNEKPVAMVKDIAVSVPAASRNPNMQLFDGVDDGKGGINWVNPKPIDKDLLTYDITTLDFYPPDYLPVLKELKKDYANKRYTDSLYYSFAGYPVNEMSADIITEDYNISSDEEGVFENVGADTSNKKAKYRYQQGQDSLILTKKDTAGKQADYGNDYYDYNYRIDPAKIKAIWDKKFNNIILATKEFEERLRYLHTISNGITADLLSIYVNNLDKPLYVLDSLCAKAIPDDYRAYHRFIEFASRKDGSVKLAGDMQQKLSDYFQKRSAAYRDAARKTWEKYEAEWVKLNKEVESKRTEEAVKHIERVQKLFDEEFCINLTDAYRQAGVSRTCNDTVPVLPLPPATYEIIISTPGWKNLDMYVFDATTNRESMNYTDPETGRTATLTYQPLTIHIEKQSSYDRVLVYLVPDSLSSFQRMEQQGDVFKENLNMLFRYDLVIMGYRGEEIYYRRERSIKPGEYVFGLVAINQEVLGELLREYNKIKPTGLKEELEYQLAEQNLLNRTVELRKLLDFREHIIMAIFCCMEGEYAEINRK